MSRERVRFDRHGAVALLTLDRPERRNALDARTLDEIDVVLAEVEADDALRALVVTGAGETFSSGFDLKEQLERAPRGVDEWRPILAHDLSTRLALLVVSETNDRGGARSLLGRRLRACVLVRSDRCRR